MASRKRTVLPPTMSLFGAPPAPPKPYDGLLIETDHGPAIVTTEPPDTPVLEERKLRLVQPEREEEVSVEPAGDDRFLVSLVKHNGGTRAHVYYSREQLKMLMRRIPAALEVG